MVVKIRYSFKPLISKYVYRKYWRNERIYKNVELTSPYITGNEFIHISTWVRTYFPDFLMKITKCHRNDEKAIPKIVANARTHDLSLLNDLRFFCADDNSFTYAIDDVEFRKTTMDNSQRSAFQFDIIFDDNINRNKFSLIYNQNIGKPVKIPAILQNVDDTVFKIKIEFKTEEFICETNLKNRKN